MLTVLAILALITLGVLAAIRLARRLTRPDRPTIEEWQAARNGRPLVSHVEISPVEPPIPPRPE
jgi:hypothetical protein